MIHQEKCTKKCHSKYYFLVFLVLDKHSGSCSWTISFNTSVITMEDIKSLSSQICLSLGCGEVYKLRAFDAKFNSTCLTGCLYHNSVLKNCSLSVRSHCKILSEVICGKTM